MLRLSIQFLWSICIAYLCQASNARSLKHCKNHWSQTYQNLRSRNLLVASFSLPRDVGNYYQPTLKEVIGPLARNHPPTMSLMKIASDLNVSTSQMRRNIQSWLKEQGLGEWKILFANEVHEWIAEQSRAGALPPTNYPSKDPFDRPYTIGGYVAAYVWDKMILERIFPVMDEHDFFLHLPSLTLPGFVEALDNQARFTNVWLGEGLNEAHFPFLIEGFNTAEEKAFFYVLRFMATTVRFMSQENLPIIYGDEFTIQGATGTRFFSPRYEYKRFQSPLDDLDVMVDLLMGTDSTDDNPPPLPLSALPKFDEFLRSAGADGAAYQSLLEKLGIAETTQTTIRHALTEALKPAYLTKPRDGEKRPEKYRRIVAQIPRIARQNEMLREFFRTENRIAFLAKSPLILESYLRWIFTN